MGKIRLTVREVAESKGIKNPFALSQATGIYYAAAHKLWQGNQELIGLSTLTKLCDALKVTPGRFFEYERD
jgi:DNA-binding Xre family transcriptional regulator